jgi:F0F1-type ATP synthase membrane subunit b/b'
MSEREKNQIWGLLALICVISVLIHFSTKHRIGALEDRIEKLETPTND